MSFIRQNCKRGEIYWVSTQKKKGCNAFKKYWSNPRQVEPSDQFSHRDRSSSSLRQTADRSGRRLERQSGEERWKNGGNVANDRQIDRKREREMLWGLGLGQSMSCGSEQGKTAAAAAAAGAMFSQRTTGFYLHTTRLTHVECHGFHTSIYSSTHLL